MGAREIGLVWFFPFPRRVTGISRRDINCLMKPSMPLRRHPGCLSKTVVNHPAALGVLTIGIVFIALAVFSDQLATLERPKPGADRLTVPPAENLSEPHHEFAARTKPRDVYFDPPRLPASPKGFCAICHSGRYSVHPLERCCFATQIDPGLV